MSGRVSLSNVALALDKLTDEERAALRASRFHSQPAPEPDRGHRRLAHPGGPLATNKAAALAKFLKRKLEGDGPATLDPNLVERAVENAKASSRYGLSVALESVRHVDSFSEAGKGEDEDEDEDLEAVCKASKVRESVAADGNTREKKKKKKKKRKKEPKAVEAVWAGSPMQSRKKERKGLTSKTSKKNLKAAKTSLKVKEKKISKREKKRPRS